jgi:hypothetical protein
MRPPHPRTLLAAGVMLAAALLLAPPVGAASRRSCLTGSAPEVAQDGPQIRAVRADIDAACPCASYDGGRGRTEHDYVACASARLRLAVDAGTLRSACVRPVREMYTSSTCGSDPAVKEAPCVTRWDSGKVTCSVKPTLNHDGSPTQRCADRPRRVRSSCSAWTSCIDAADGNHDLVLAGPGDSGACNASDPTPTPTATPAPTPTATPAPPVIDCVVTAWSDWGACSATCGGGTQPRSRQVVTEPQNGGAACPALTDQRACNDQPCMPIDCVVTAWGPWGECSQTCGGGTQSRSRQIVTQPQDGGAACPTLSDTQSCNTQPCP